MDARLLLPAALLALVPAAALAAPALSGEAEAGPRMVRKSRAVFGTMIEIMASVPPGDGPAAGAPFDAAFDEVARVEQLVDEDDPRSGVARINAAAGGAAVVVEPELFALLSEAIRLAKLTKGAFDITAAAYDAAWRFGGDEAPTVDPATGEGDGRAPVPSRRDIDRMRALVGVDDLALDAAARAPQSSSRPARASACARWRAPTRSSAAPPCSRPPASPTSSSRRAATWWCAAARAIGRGWSACRTRAPPATSPRSPSRTAW
ncbi:MAG: hypothetical protein A2138_07300 [Deltaproteobacteria bacterium RBG_16_71_12]|nr:MAG: hypothetical protein A2138_07300 [Deltaproteobacteria bacterium RBG_16_71_12]